MIGQSLVLALASALTGADDPRDGIRRQHSTGSCSATDPWCWGWLLRSALGAAGRWNSWFGASGLARTSRGGSTPGSVSPPTRRASLSPSG